jgi:hypothetical protein
MVAEVFAGLGALKTAFDIARGLKDIDDATRRNAAVIELQEKILSAQQSQSRLIDTVSDLEKQIAEMNAWVAEKERYELRAISFRSRTRRLLSILSQLPIQKRSLNLCCRLSRLANRRTG